MKVEYRLAGTAIVLETDEPNTPGVVQVEGMAAAAVQYILRQSYGAFGHLLSPDAITPIDLDYVMRQLQAEVVAGVANYDPDIPKDAVT